LIDNSSQFAAVGIGLLGPVQQLVQTGITLTKYNALNTLNWNRSDSHATGRFVWRFHGLPYFRNVGASRAGKTALRLPRQSSWH
jgi:hypothetical protein